MKRIRVTLIGLGVAAAVLGAPAAAQAGTHHHKDAGKCAVAPKCRPAPLPKPINGWPCAKDKSCGERHHRPVCPPPIVSHPVPPVVHTPKPPKHDTPKPVTPQRVTAASPMLPRTGGVPLPLAFAGGAFVLGGAGLKRLARVR